MELNSNLPAERKLWSVADELIAKKGFFLGVHSDREEPSQFAAGLVTAANRDWFCLTSLGRMGDFDCVLVGRTSEVYSLSTSGAYFERLQQLGESALQGAEIFEDVFGILEFSSAKNEVIAIEFFDGTEIYAIVQTYNERMVSVYEFDEIIADRVASYALDDIRSCRLRDKMALVWGQWHRRGQDGNIR